MCSHGVPFGKDDVCLGCKLIWHQGCLDTAQEQVARHSRIVAEIERSLADGTEAATTPPSGLNSEAGEQP